MSENQIYTYYQMPKFLFSEEIKLSSNAKLTYMLLLDRMRLSQLNEERFTDSNGTLFVIFSYKDISRLLGCGKNAVTRYIGELKKAGLVRMEKNGFSEFRIYLNDTSECENLEKSEPEYHEKEDTEYHEKEDTVYHEKEDAVYHEKEDAVYHEKGDTVYHRKGDVGIPDLGICLSLKQGRNNNKYNNNEYIKKGAYRKKKTETPEPSYDLDKFTRRAFMNPMNVFKKDV